jgi:sec-independent protein translocase protein TatB
VLNLDPSKLLIIAVVAVILLGPDKLPQVARQVGAAWRSFNEFRHRMESEVRNSIPDLPSSADIARLARSPSALLNHLSTLTPEGAAEEAASGAAANGVAEEAADGVSANGTSAHPPGAESLGEQPATPPASEPTTSASVPATPTMPIPSTPSSVTPTPSPAPGVAASPGVMGVMGDPSLN